MSELNHTTATAKDIFLAKLEGLGLFFGLIDYLDYPDFIRFAIDHNLLEFYTQKEYRGNLGMFKAKDNFDFAITDAGTQFSYRARPVKVKKNDFIEFTEHMSSNDYRCERLNVKTDQQKHILYVDYDDRNKTYKAYNFDA